MRKTLAAAAYIAALVAFAAPASAATLLATTGTPLTDVVKTDTVLTSTDILYTSTPHLLNLDYTSTSALSPSSSGGFAFVQGGTSSGFANLTITPQSFTFSDFKFNIQLPAATSPEGATKLNKADFTFDTTVFFDGGGSHTFTTDVGAGNGVNRFLITAGLNEEINKIVFDNLVDISGNNNGLIFSFDSLRQVSFDAVGGVPEPATWALFILGFGFVGGMLRSARTRQGASLAV
ncbi:MAG TPA: PEPxxWA-CTERM sorting domain-containing protein [Rhizomicrobium sp.]